jgi:hypothetical protein
VRGFKPVPTGIEHGTITVVIATAAVRGHDLARGRRDLRRHAKVRFGARLARDAERRDFTMNALSRRARRRRHDYVGGIADVEARRVRFIGEARNAHRRGLPAHPALLRFPCRLWPWAPMPRGLPPASPSVPVSRNCRASG